MSYNPYCAHLDEEVLSADPVDLVIMLFSRLQSSIQQARLSLKQGDAAGRSGHVNRGIEIVAELAVSLDAQQGGELAANLRRLYQYLLDKLIQGHCTQADEPFEEAETVASMLLEAWRELGRTQALSSLAALRHATSTAEEPSVESLSYKG